MRARPTRRRRATFAFAFASIVALSLVATACAPDAHVEIDVPPQTAAALPDETVQQLQDAVTHAMTAAGASGAIVGVWAPWSGEFVTGLGVESPGGDQPVSAEMQFRAAQLTRPMICDVLYAVADEGTVRLDDAVAEWVSGFPDLTDITLDQLCDSTSGIGSYSSQLAGMFLSNPGRVWNPRELASYGIGQPRGGEPGAAYRDSDAGYVILGVALERATGRSAAQLLTEYVFDPLDLTETRLPGAVAAPPSTGPVLTGHHSLRDGAGTMNCAEPLEMTSLSASSGFTDSGVVTDIDDIGRYVQGLATGALLPEGADRFEQPLAVYADAPSWYTTRGGAIQAGSLVGQSGSVPGYATAAFSDPKSGLTVAVVLNNSAVGGGFTQYLAWELAAIASKAPAAAGATAPDAGLPWTAQQYHELIAASAICSAPAG
ncbi:beta-lactamase family protein [Microbacterium sp. zg.B48]|uniref:serine hydrolase domain-containing protein n=1 Tax=Microbacterium sp. zg.B48 TaxID=2969408 RepID=UPI00214C26E8|nr:serine hydrolase domain-containing protein [Microbacterium sp. zg.B48]MCR2762808.1 beta-lactamase family protein [Microbacterium sp. zg.B48]